jgi:glycosyltransferase involved in cell wall biosynthesis
VNVVIVSGICVASDAISNAVVEQARILRGLERVDSVAVVTQYCDRATAMEVEVHCVWDAWSLLRLPVVQQADLVVFHWGIEYALFDALPIVAQRCRAAVHFHNVTPPSLVPDTERPKIERSLRQIQLLNMTDALVWTESEYNISTLEDWGVASDRITLMPFPIGPSRELTRVPRERAVRLLTVGRFVRAKGIDVLIDALGIATRRTDVPIEATIVGNVGFSDPAYIDEIGASIRTWELDDVVRFVHGADDEQLWAWFERTDVLVSPSLHEGLCVPAIEAYIAGCRVIGSDAGNLPYVVQPPDPVVAAGDADALAAAIVQVVQEVSDGRIVRPAGADALVRRYSAEATTECLREALAPFRDGAVSGLVTRR